MPAASNLASYDDVRAVFDEGLRSGFPMEYELSSPQAAARWRFRAYSFRKRTAVTAYKDILLRIDKSAPCIVIIAKEEVGTLRTADGERLEPKIDPTLDPELAALREELGLNKGD